MNLVSHKNHIISRKIATNKKRLQRLVFSIEEVYPNTAHPFRILSITAFFRSHIEKDSQSSGNPLFTAKYLSAAFLAVIASSKSSK